MPELTGEKKDQNKERDTKLRLASSITLIQKLTLLVPGTVLGTKWAINVCWMNKRTGLCKETDRSFNRRENGQNRYRQFFPEQHKNPHWFKREESLVYTEADILNKETASFCSVPAHNSRRRIFNCFCRSRSDLFCSSLITVPRTSTQMPEGDWLCFTLSSASLCRWRRLLSSREESDKIPWLLAGR